MRTPGNVPTAAQSADMAELMEQSRRQQDEFQRIQRTVEALEVTGGSRHDEVRVTMRGDRRVTDVSIDPGMVGEFDADQLSEIVKEALSDAIHRVAEATAAQFQPFIEAASQPVQL